MAEKQIQAGHGYSIYSVSSLDRRVRKDHILRKIKKDIDFDFASEKIIAKHGSGESIPVPPSVILKLTFLLCFYNVKSERELMNTLAERLDWMWFVDYGIGSETPFDNILSRAVCKWGETRFSGLFGSIVKLAVKEGYFDFPRLLNNSMVNISDNPDDLSKKKYLSKKAFDIMIGEKYRTFQKRLSDTGSLTNNSETGSHIDTDNRDYSDTDLELKAGYLITPGISGKNRGFPRQEFTYNTEKDVFIDSEENDR